MTSQDFGRHTPRKALPWADGGTRTSLEPKHPFEVGERLAVVYRYPMDNPALHRRAAVRYECWALYLVGEYINPNAHREGPEGVDTREGSTTFVIDTSYIEAIKSFDDPRKVWHPKTGTDADRFQWPAGHGCKRTSPPRSHLNESADVFGDFPSCDNS